MKKQNSIFMMIMVLFMALALSMTMIGCNYENGGGSDDGHQTPDDFDDVNTDPMNVWIYNRRTPLALGDGDSFQIESKPPIGNTWQVEVTDWFIDAGRGDSFRVPFLPEGYLLQLSYWVPNNYVVFEVWQNYEDDQPVNEVRFDWYPSDDDDPWEPSM
ncbi:MAG: hypothetical protein ACLFUS_14910 [Candidatus Sumerlaeia bacterium]